MTEARVECLCTSYNIPDLGLELRKGQIVWMDESRARASKELAIAKRAGAISVRWEERCTVSRSPTPPFLKRRPAVPSFATQTVAPAAVDHAEVAAKTAEALRDVVRQELQEALKGLHVGQKADADAIGAVVRQALASAETGRGDTRAPVIGSDAPVFIPAKITPDGAQTSINVTTETSGSSSVEDAAAMLKAARAGRKAKAKTTEDTDRG